MLNALKTGALLLRVRMNVVSVKCFALLVVFTLCFIRYLKVDETDNCTNDET